MHFSIHAILVGLLGFASVSTALPVTNLSGPALLELINGTEPVLSNNTEAFLWLVEPPEDHPWLVEPPEDHPSLVARGLPPRNRKFADHMENYGETLPECYKKCLRSEDGKSSIHMGQDTLGQICGKKWILFKWWSEHHIYYCVNGKGGCTNKGQHQKAYEWLQWTCDYKLP
ncbi:hypothetical protein J7T55_000259 [Diaporthe amygdali]|uniref:uncharacterized protein n=1 Tax=Phomopsis amygdali TaxID=1214568 RepID=UPI0022FDD91F|nr:uncharacterized protein J7T55_000259 [Diaporthe amygdali]KAJ0109334.1 hypothetical protein J7T55_000259 [Diaporthe amygdali]